MLQLKFSHLNKDKFRHSFKEALSPICGCGSGTEAKDHFFLCWPFFVINRQRPLNNLVKIDPSLRNLKNELLLDIILYGSDRYKETVNKEIFFMQLVLSKIPSAFKTTF